MAKNNLGLHNPIFLNEARVSGAAESERDKRKLYLHLEALHTAHIGGWTQWKKLKWEVRFLQTDHLSSHVKRKIYSTWSGESLTVRSWQMIKLYSWGRRGREPILWCTKDPSTLVALSAQTTQNSSHWPRKNVQSEGLQFNMGEGPLHFHKVVWKAIWCYRVPCLA